MKQIAAIPALTPPVLGDNMFALATNTGATRVIIPDRWKGGSLTIMSQGADTYVAFGKVTDDVSITGLSTLSSNVITSDGDECFAILDGTSATFDLAQLRDRISAGDVEALIFRCSAGGGDVRFLVSSGQAGSING